LICAFTIALNARIPKPSYRRLSGPTMDRPQKITLGEMRAMGIRGLLVYCSDYKCSHNVEISADPWPDDVRLSDLEPLFTCQACGIKGAEVRADFNWASKQNKAHQV
jgi:hypothetical protein